MKHTRKTRWTAALLLTLLLASCAPAGPGEDTSAPVDSSSADTTTADVATESTTVDPFETPDNLPEMTFKGATYIIMGRTDYRKNYGFDLTEEEATDVLTTAQYERTKRIEEKYDVDISFFGVEHKQEVTNLRTAAQAGTTDFCDIIMPNGNGYGAIGTAAVEGLLTDWNTLTYTNLEQPWWNTSAIENNSLKGKVYAAFGALTDTRSSVQSLIINRDLAEANGMETPYDLVLEGKWTYDKFMEMVNTVKGDTNGDGVYDDTDTYGLLTNQSFSGFFQNYFWGVDTVRIVDDELVLDVDAERLDAVVNKIFSTQLGNNTVWMAAGSENANRFKMFAAGQGLFLIYNTGTSYNDLRGIESFTYGFIPVPKFDESEEYSGGVDSIVAMFSQLKNVDKTDIITEALCADSYKQVRRTFYDTIMSTQLAQDPRDAEMLDLIWNNRIVEPTIVWLEKQNLMLLTKNCVIKNTTDTASAIAAESPAVEAAIKEMNEFLANLG